MDPLSILGMVQVGLQAAPSIISAVETLFKHKPAPTNPDDKQAQSDAKKEAALKMAETGMATALALDPADFGPAEKQLIVSVHDAVVAYFNARGWPTK